MTPGWVVDGESDAIGDNMFGQFLKDYKPTEW